MKRITRHASQNVEGSLSDVSRRKRMQFFKEFCGKIGRELKIADVGGTFYHWKGETDLLKSVKLTLLNTEEEPEELPANVKFVKADARDLVAFRDAGFDIAYSNSVIEHFRTFEEQKTVAGNIMMIAPHYFVQTPNFYFPMEPHFLFPYFQLLPQGVKKKLVMNLDLGWYEKQPDEHSAGELASSIRLLRLNELKQLFPGSKIYKEKLFMMNKSFIAYR